MEKVTDDTLDTFAKLKIQLIRYHIGYAEQLGFVDETAIKYSYTDAIKHYKENDYEQYLIKDNNLLGILETRKKESSIYINQECLSVENIYFDEQYRGNGYLKQTLSILKGKNKNIELECYYNLPAHIAYQELGFKRFKTRYFI